MYAHVLDRAAEVAASLPGRALVQERERELGRVLGMGPELELEPEQGQVRALLMQDLILPFLVVQQVLVLELEQV